MKKILALVLSFAAANAVFATVPANEPLSPYAAVHRGLVSMLDGVANDVDANGYSLPKKTLSLW